MSATPELINGDRPLKEALTSNDFISYQAKTLALNGLSGRLNLNYDLFVTAPEVELYYNWTPYVKPTPLIRQPAG